MKNFFAKKKAQATYTDPVLGLESNTPPSNPYIDARREWSERYGDYIAQKSMWQKLAFASLGICAIAVLGNVYQASQSKVRTYIVQVNKLGEAMNVTSADSAAPTDRRYVAAQLERYITEARSVTSDPKVQKQWLDDVYAMSGPAAANYLNQYYKQAENQPFNLMRTETRTVQMSPATPMSDKTWQLEWEESRYTLTGDLIGRQRYSAIISSAQINQTDPKAIMKNVSGTIAETLAWNQRL